MTSPVRKRRDRSRKRLASAESLEIIEQARGFFSLQPFGGDTGANCERLEPLTRTHCAMIAQAVRGGWLDTDAQKRARIVGQLMQAVDSTDDRLAVSAARVVLLMMQANQAAQKRAMAAGVES